MSNVMTTPLHREIDLTMARRVFTFGDLHGRLDLLIAAMKRVDFDADAGDWLIGLGDWLDRGPDTLAIATFIDNQQNLAFVRGNHEQLLWGMTHECFFPSSAIIRNGGKWTLEHLDRDGAELPGGRHFLDADGTHLQNLVNNAPLAITIRTPGGRKVGMSHADVPMDDWDDFTNHLEAATRNDMGGEDTVQNAAMWGRKTITRLQRAQAFGTLDGFDCTITGIDHVFHGHTVLKLPVSHCNRSWIDTGAYKFDVLTFVEIDEWIDAL